MEWIGTPIPRSQFDQDLLFTFGAFLTVFRARRNDAENRVLAMLGMTSTSKTSSTAMASNEDEKVEDNPPFDLEGFTQDQLRTHITRKFAGHALAKLVGEILRAEGYSVMISPEGPDGGVDVLAGGGKAGFEPPLIAVQVKSGAGVTDAPTLQQLKGAMKDFNATLLVKMGGEMGLPTRALLTSMEQPLGHAVGNTLEILEVWDALSGVVEVRDLTELGLTLASQMLLMARPQLGLEDARTLTTNALATGAAKDVFISWIDQQGGDVAAMESRRGMQLASSITEVRAPHDGWISRINAKAVGELLLDLGGGRRSKNDSIDLGVGVCVAKKVGDIVAAGDVVLKVMGRSELDIEADKFFNFSHEFVSSPSLVEELVI